MRKLLLALAVLLLWASPAAAQTGWCGQNGAASNNAGYCSIAAGGPYTSISGQLQTPLVTYNGPPRAQGPTAALHWLGLGTYGLNSLSSTVIQAGLIEQSNASGSTTYQIFYGAGGSISKPSNVTWPPAAGDLLTTQIIQITGTTWNFVLTDLHADGTPNWVYDYNVDQGHYFSYGVSPNCWEVITEQPLYGGGQGYIANYGKVVWKNILVNGANPSLASNQLINNTDAQNNTDSFSNPDTSTDGFTDCYGQGGFSTCGNNQPYGRTSAGGAGR